MPTRLGEPGDIDHTASVVIEGIVPRAPASPDVTAFWLAWKRISEAEWTVRSGEVLAITEGVNVMTYLTFSPVE